MENIFERIEKVKRIFMRIMPKMDSQLVAKGTENPMSNLTISEIKLLHLFKDQEKYKMSELAKACGMPLPTATHVVDKLVKNNLVKRTLDENDRRVIFVEFTEEGRKVMTVCDAHHKENVKKMMSILDKGDQERLVSTMEQFAAVIEEISQKMEKKKTIKENRILKTVLAFLFAAGAIFSPLAAAEQKKLSFDAYISEVKANNPDLKSTALFIDAMGKKISQSEMVYFPRFIGNYTYLDDKSGAGFGSTLPLKENNTYSLDLGLSKKWNTGTVTSLGFTNSISAIDLSSPYALFPGLTVSNFTGYSTSAYVKVEQSLIKELVGGATEAGINKAKAGVRSGQYMKQFAAQQQLLRARSTYLALSLARDVVSFRKQELKRAEDILKWNEDRVYNDLADKGDLLQAKGFLGLRKLNMQMAVEDERKTSRAFNELRGKEGSVVEESVTGLDEITSFYAKIEDLKVSGKRADVLSAKASLESASFAKTEITYSLLPDVSVFGKVTLSGLDLTNDGSFSQVTNASKPIYLFGVNLNLPLDFGSSDLINKGYDLDVDSAREALNKAELAANKDWLNLSENWKNVKTRLETALYIKNIQTERLEYARERFVKGRQTMAQLVMTENDLDDATLNYYRFVIEQVGTYYEAELFSLNETKGE